MRIHLRATACVAVLSGLALIAGCTAASSPSTGIDHASPTTHVHAIIADPESDGFLLATHQGIYATSAEGELLARVSDYAFDAMALSTAGSNLISSGHPGEDTPGELGERDLGIIVSVDAGQIWQPAAFTGEKDFHTLSESADGVVYGMATDSIAVQVSNDGGYSWVPTGGEVLAMSLVVEADGSVIAATPEGLQISTDDAQSFLPWSDAPKLYGLSASPNRELIVGADAQDRIWVFNTTEDTWLEAGTVHGPGQAFAITDAGDILIADESGLTLLTSPIHETTTSE